MRSIFTTAALSMVAFALCGGTARAAIELDLDFINNGGVYTTGYTPVQANFLADTATASVSSINGTGYGFSVNHVGTYDNGSATESLTRSGFYTFGNSTNDHTFTLTGLNPGDVVTAYGVAGWDGNGRGATVTFGTNTAGIQAQTIGDPGNAPTLANFTALGTATVGIGQTSVSGMLYGALGIPSQTIQDSEGQLGGMIFVVTAAPEPASLGLLGAAGLIALRRRRA